MAIIKARFIFIALTTIVLLTNFNKQDPSCADHHPVGIGVDVGMGRGLVPVLAARRCAWAP